MDNPFKYGAVVTDAQFVGREKELAELELDVRSGQNVVIISRRRYGKSSLVLQAVKRLRTQDVLVAYLDLTATPTKELLVDGLATALYSGLTGFRDRALHKVQDWFSKHSLRPAVTITPEGVTTVELFAGDRARNTDAILRQVLEIPGQVARDGKRVAVVLDEFQEAVSIDPHLPALIRSVWQLQPDVSHLFLGSKRHMMARIFTDENEPMFRMAKPLSLGPIPAATFAGFIRDRFAATKQQIADDAVDRILQITECHPGDTQELAYFVWSLAATEHVPATVELVDYALVQVIEAENTRYTELWIRLSAHQRIVLTALVSSDGASIYSEAYRRRHRLGPASSVQRSMRALSESDLVEEMPAGGYRVPDAFLRAWLARTMAASTTIYPQAIESVSVVGTPTVRIQPPKRPKR